MRTGSGRASRTKRPRSSRGNSTGRGLLATGEEGPAAYDNDLPPFVVPLPMLDPTPRPAAGAQRKRPACIALLQVLEVDIRACLMRISSLIRRISSVRRAIRPEPGSAELACPRAVVRASRARAMAWTADERTRRGQCLGRGSGKWGCGAMKVLSKDLGELSGQAGVNARERLDLPDIGAT